MSHQEARIQEKLWILVAGMFSGATKKERSATIWLIVLPIALAIIGALTLLGTRRRRRMLSQS